MSLESRPPRAIRPARIVDVAGAANPQSVRSTYRVMMVDLNNFTSFPTYAIGLLVASLRNRGNEVQVICPLSHDVPSVQRERQENLLDHLQRRIHLSTLPTFLDVRDGMRAARNWFNERPHPVVLRELEKALTKPPDVILLSAYLQHFATVREIGRLALAKGVPVVLGGPMFNLLETAEAWRQLPGLSAVVGAEVDKTICDLVEAVCERRDLRSFAGVVLPDGSRGLSAPPLRALNDTPMPDYTDFPWDRYPVRIVPLMTGRGCQWDKCLFCSDVISTSGRTFRTRSVENVLLEMQEQSRRHATSNFLFLDLKLNSYPDMIRGIASAIQQYVPGAEWVGSVHVDLRRDNGLSRNDLDAAVKGGMRRISFGLESGSQRMLDLMHKGSSVEANSEFIRNAHASGLSIRCTMFKGFPGEAAEDMEATADFLEAHSPYLDRVRFNEFSLLQDTPIYKALMEKNEIDQPIKIHSVVRRRARAEYRNFETDGRAYRKAKARTLRAVFAINRKALRISARQFDGLM